MSKGLPEFFHYNLWANLHLLDFCEQLSDEQLDATVEGTYGSVKNTLWHMLASEEGYARHFNITSTTPSPMLKEYTEFPSFDELRKRAKRSGKELIAIVEQKDLSQIMHLDDGTYDAELYIVMIQAINHGVDHRSHIATILSQQGVQTPDLSAWGYNDSLS